MAPGRPNAPTERFLPNWDVALDWDDVPGAASWQLRIWVGWDHANNTDQWIELPGDGITVAFSGSEAVVSDLPSYHFFHFAVRAGNEAGWSEWSDFSYGLTNPRYSKWWPDPHPAPAEPAPGPARR